MSGAPSSQDGPLFQTVTLIGLGLIGSSLARALKAEKLAGRIVAVDRSAETRAKVMELGLADACLDDMVEAVKGTDLVVLCTPIGTYDDITRLIAPHLGDETILSDVGSVKEAVLRDVSPHLRPGIHFVPGHPVAGTEHSGPEAGFAELFKGRWCILTPPPGTDAKAVAKVEEMWRRVGSKVVQMPAEHHDRVLAITSHLPHLIAYTIVGTATDLEQHIQTEVIKFSAGGFRDFTRIAASDPVMWRDIFLNNRDAVLEMLGRLSEDLAVLQRAIRMGDGKTLEDKFTATRAIRRGIIAANQA